jgi:hypothetical protein
MKVILEKHKNGWRCLLCDTIVAGWLDSEHHAHIQHGIPRDWIATDPNDGRIMDIRGLDPDTLRLVGAI